MQVPLPAAPPIEVKSPIKVPLPAARLLTAATVQDVPDHELARDDGAGYDEQSGRGQGADGARAGATE